MRGSIGRYQKQTGATEIRMHFPKWPLPDGTVATNVSIFPHKCDTCVGGDHTHVEVNDDRPALEILVHDLVELSAEHKAALDRLLLEKLAIDARTQELFEYVAGVTYEHAH